MQSVFCRTRNRLSYDGCKSSERQSPSEVGSALDSTSPHPPPPPVPCTLPNSRWQGSSFSKVPIKRNKCCAVFSQLSAPAAPACFLTLPNSKGPPSPSRGARPRENRGTDEREAGRRWLLRGDKRSSCGGRTRQEWLHHAACRVFLVLILFAPRKLCSVVRGDILPMCLCLCEVTLILKQTHILEHFFS